MYITPTEYLEIIRKEYLQDFIRYGGTAVKFIVPSHHEFNIRKLAELNERDETFLRVDIKVILEKDLLHDYHMCHEFRNAMRWLCLAQLDKSDVYPVSEDVIKAWLRGELSRVSEIKPALIFKKITRQNARHMLSSLSHWLHLGGKGGVFKDME